MTDICCDNAGGRIIMTIDGRRFQTRGGVTIKPQNFERTANANDDGTIYVTTKPKPPMASFTLSDKCGLLIDDVTAACHVDVTFDLIDMKKRFLFTKASIVGEPEYNSETGEIRGLSVTSSLVKQLPY